MQRQSTHGRVGQPCASPATLHRGRGRPLEFSVAGWVKHITPQAWAEMAEIATATGRPWSSSMMLSDLAYFADRHAVTGRKRPPRRELIRRWNCSHYTARQVLSGVNSTTFSAKNRPEFDQSSTTVLRSNAMYAQKIDQKPSRIRPKTVPRACKTSDSDSDSDNNSPSARLAKDAQAVYSHWRTYHPRADTLADPKRLDTIRRALERARRTAKADGKSDPSKAALVACVTICDWIHTSADAAFWQGANDAGKKYLNPETIYKPTKWADRLDQAREWYKQGSPANATNPGAKAEALQQWTRFTGIRPGAEYPNPLHSDKAIAVALSAALDAVGWRRGIASRRIGSNKTEQCFVDAFCAARGA